mgnify:CR=1 FL=1
MAYIVKRGRAYDAEILRSFDSMVQRVFGAAGVNLNPFPAVDAREDEDRYVVEVELPGFSQDDVNIQVKERVLTIESVEQTGEEGDETRGSRRRVRPFVRQFTLPKYADVERIEAAFVNGVLVVTIHKQPETEPRKITIHSVQ